MMRLSKTIENAVCFAKWCINNKCDPRQTGELRTLVNQRANTWVRQNNQECDWDTAEKRMEQLDKKIEKLVADMGLTDFDYPGLYPTFKTPGSGVSETMLPEV